MNKKLLFPCLLLAGALTSAFAQEPVDTAMVRKIRDEGLNHSKVMETAFYLTDVSGPRISGSPELKHAQDWAVNQLKSWGLVNAKREPWGKFGRGWEVKKDYVAMTEPYYHALINVPKAWTPSTNGLIKGDVIMLKADTITDLDKYKGQLKGKIIIFDTKPPVERSYKPDAVRYTDEQLADMTKPQEPRQRRNFDRSAFMRQRAFRAEVGEFLVKEGVGLVLTQARGTDGTVFTTNGASYADTAKAVSPELETSSEDFQRILRLVKAGIKVTVEADIKTKFYSDDEQGYDVVAEIPGTDPKLKDQW